MELNEFTRELESLYAFFPRAHKLPPASVATWFSTLEEFAPWCEPDDLARGVRRWGATRQWFPNGPAPLIDAIKEARAEMREARRMSATYDEPSRTAPGRRASPEHVRRYTKFILDLFDGKTKKPEGASDDWYSHQFEEMRPRQ